MSDSDFDTFAVKRAKDFAAGKNLVHAYIEKPAMYALLPELSGKSVLCVGCGTGEECAELKKRGAEVTGTDISAASIDYASKNIEEASFRVVDMDDSAALGSFGQGNFDLIYSSLTLHYSNDLGKLLNTLRKLLKPKGMLLFSVGHPLRWAADVQQDSATKSVLMGYSQSADQTHIYGDYLSTKQFTQKLSDGPEVTYWMRPVSEYFRLLNDAGYQIVNFKEPVPIDEARNVDEAFWELRTKIPVDLVFLAQV